MDRTIFRETKDMAVFEAVARHGSITAAARELRISKQTVSDQIRRLEVRTGTRLLQRSTRRVVLTDAGQRIYPYCRDMVQAARGALDEIEGDAHAPGGLLTVASTRTFGRLFLADVLFDYLAAYPDVQVDLRLDDRRFQIVEEGIDVSFQVAPPQEQSLVVRTLGPAISCLVASPAFMDSLGTASDTFDIRPEDMIEWRQLSGSDAATLHRARLVAPSAEIALAAAVRGLGVTKAPLILARPFIEDGSLCRLPDPGDQQSGTFAAVYPSRQHLPPKVRVLIDMVVAQFGRAALEDPD